MPFVFSTLTNDHKYTNWRTPNEKSMIRIIDGEVLIRGGANLATADNPKFAPKGVMTEVSDQQMEILEKNSQFKKHVAKGLIFVTREHADPEVVAKSDMLAKDNSAPLTPDSEIFNRPDPDGNTITPLEGKPSMIDRVKRGVGL